MKKILFGALAVCFVFALLGCEAEVTDVFKDGPVTISFDLYYEGAPAGPESFQLEYGTAIGDKIPAAPATRQGFYFLGWYAYGAGGWEEVKTTDVFTMNTTIYAQWGLVKDVVISFDLNYQFAPASPVSVTIKNTEAIGSKLPAAPSNVNSYYTFQGWGKTRLGGIVGGTDTFAADTTLYAVWADTRETITISYDWNKTVELPGKLPDEIPPVALKKGSMITAANIPDINWGWGLDRFKGWYDDPTSGNLVKRTDTFTANTTLYAQYNTFNGIVLDLSENITSTSSANGGVFTGTLPGGTPTSTTNWTTEADGSRTIEFAGTDYAFIKLSTANRTALINYWSSLPGSNASQRAEHSQALRFLIDGDYRAYPDVIQADTFRYFLARTGTTNSWNGTATTTYRIWPDLLDLYGSFSTNASATTTNSVLQYLTIMKGDGNPGTLNIRSIVIVFTGIVKE